MSEKQKSSAETKTWVFLGCVICVVIVVMLVMSLISRFTDDSDNTESMGEPSETSLGLEPDTALVACKREAKQQAPYGFDYSILNTSYTVDDDSITYVFRDAKVTNMYGAELTQTVMCQVGGTDSAPTIEGFGAIE